MSTCFNFSEGINFSSTAKHWINCLVSFLLGISFTDDHLDVYIKTPMIKTYIDIEAIPSSKWDSRDVAISNVNVPFQVILLILFFVFVNTNK